MRGIELDVIPPPPPDDPQTPPPHAPPHSDRAVDMDEHSQSSSPSSLYSIPQEDPRLLSHLEGVLREGTATPSESHRDQDVTGEGSRRKNRDRSDVRGKSSEGVEDDEEVEQNDVNSEPEMANDSSAEEEDLGEDEETLVETLSLKLGQSSSSSSVKAASISTATPSTSTANFGGTRQAGVGSDEEVGKGEEDDPNMQLAVLRKLLLNELVGNLHLLEAAGGMRAVCYLQVRAGCVDLLHCDS